MGHEPGKLHDLLRPLRGSQLPEIPAQSSALHPPVRAPISDSAGLVHAEIVPRASTRLGWNPVPTYTARVEAASEDEALQKVREALDPDTGNFSNWEVQPA
jgi:hypothetical protein